MESFWFPKADLLDLFVFQFWSLVGQARSHKVKLLFLSQQEATKLKGTRQGKGLEKPFPCRTAGWATQNAHMMRWLITALRLAVGAPAVWTQLAALIGREWVGLTPRKTIPYTSPELVSSFFAFLGFPVFSTNQARKIIIAGVLISAKCSFLYWIPEVHSFSTELQVNHFVVAMATG